MTYRWIVNNPHRCFIGNSFNDPDTAIAFARKWKQAGNKTHLNVFLIVLDNNVPVVYRKASTDAPINLHNI
jgi:hypothetical protein